jgi:hypothetical protein
VVDGIVVCTIDVCISFPADGSIGVKVVGLSAAAVAVVSREL